MGDRDRIESVIGRSLVVKGDIQSSGTLRVDGAVEGTISAKGTVITPNTATTTIIRCVSDSLLVGRGSLTQAQPGSIVATARAVSAVVWIACLGFMRH